MNTLGYFLLIAALLVLAGAMLYARFATRSREKSLHHAPSDWKFDGNELVLPSDSATDPVFEESPEPAPDSRLRLDRSSTGEGSGAVPDPVEQREYFDELQEAAAGLAKLMRSSPTVRTDPVVFAPELDESGETAPEEEAPAVFHPFPEFVPAAEEVETVCESPSEVIEAEVEEVRMPVRSLRELLGETVSAQFDRIDEGLDALAALVAGIESSLLGLGNLEREEENLLSGREERESFSAAA